MIISVIIAISNVFLFTHFETLKDVRKFQIKNKAFVKWYILIVLVLVIILGFISIPYAYQKSIVSQETLAEILVDNKMCIIQMRAIEDAYFPTFNGSHILWYTEEFKAPYYLHSEKVNVSMHLDEPEITLYETDDSKIFTIIEAQRPVKYRSIEGQSWWYSLILILDNLFIAILSYPLFSEKKNYIEIIWKMQQTFAVILIAVNIGISFLF